MDYFICDNVIICEIVVHMCRYTLLRKARVLAVKLVDILSNVNRSHIKT